MPSQAPTPQTSKPKPDSDTIIRTILSPEKAILKRLSTFVSSVFSSKAKGKDKEENKIPAYRDASLPDKERWKEWNKAKDQERYEASATGYMAGFKKAKGGWAW